MIIKDSYKLKSDEQETIINYDRAERTATIYCSDRIQMKKLDKLCEQFPDTYKCVWTDEHIMGDGIPMGKRYSVPKKYIRFGKPPKAPTDKQVEARKKSAVRFKKS